MPHQRGAQAPELDTKSKQPKAQKWLLLVGVFTQAYATTTVRRGQPQMAQSD